jgi:hypothetical protein
MLLQQVGGASVFVELARLELGNPEPDQLLRDVMLLGEPMQGLPGQVGLRDLALELDAVGTVLSPLPRASRVLRPA